MGCKCKCQQAPATQQSPQVVNQLTFPFDKRCPTGQHWSDTAQACVDNPTCPPGSVWNETLQQCIFSSISDPSNPHPPNPPGVIAVTYNCVGGQCVDPRDGSGRFATLADCQASCFQPPPDPCFPVPTLIIEPPTGATLTFPTWITILCSRPDANIYYTTDGSTPTNLSRQYTGPFYLTSNPTAIKAIGIVTGCAGSTVASATYNTSHSLFFNFNCSTTDKAGAFGVFAANGQADFNWDLVLTLGSQKTITRVEIYQTDERGVWTTGQVWSTDEFINPIEGPANFHSFPLVIFNDGGNPNVTFSYANQIKNTYVSSFGVYNAGTYLWRLVGQPYQGLLTFPPANRFFKIKIFLSTGLVIYSIIRASCADEPADCGSSFAGTYKLDGYTPTTFALPTPGAGQELTVSAAPAWDGTFVYNYAACQFTVGSSQGRPFSMQGKDITVANLYLDNTNYAYPRWILYIQLGLSSSTTHVPVGTVQICRYEKLYGNSADGIYNLVTADSTVTTPIYVSIIQA